MTSERLKDWEEQVLTLSTKNIFEFLQTYIENRYDYLTYAFSDNDYLVMGPDEGEVLLGSVCLVAHVDTVGDYFNKEEFDLYFDIKTQSKLRSCGDCFLDDRLGVWHIITMLEQGHTPLIIFLKGEEVGCLGACALVEDYPDLDDIFPDASFNFSCLIEIDRKGVDEVVFYELDYPLFEEIFSLFYKKNLQYAFTDIAVLGPAWDIAAANVSAGYHFEHTEAEQTSLRDMFLTNNKLSLLLDFFEELKQGYKFPYKGKTNIYLSLWGPYLYPEFQKGGMYGY